jgi:hypothetical protein
MRKNTVWDDGRLGCIAKALYKLLEEYADYQNKICWPSIATLVEKSSLSKPTVRKGLRELEQYHWVMIDHCSRKLNGHSSNNYELRNPLSKESQATEGQANYRCGGKQLSLPGQALCPERNPLTKTMNRRGKSTPRGFASLGVKLGDD